MKKVIIFFSLLLVIACSHAQRLDDLEGSADRALKSAAGKAAARILESGGNQQIDKLVNEANRTANVALVGLPTEPVVCLEIKSNNSNLRDEEIVALLKASAKSWRKGILFGPSFQERQRLRSENAADRDNPELANPTAVGQAVRPYLDAQVTISQSRGGNGLSVFLPIMRKLVRSEIGFDSYRDVEFTEITVEFVDSVTRLSSPGSVYYALGYRTVYSRSSFDSRAISGSVTKSDAESVGVRDALRRLAAEIARSPEVRR